MNPPTPDRPQDSGALARACQTPVVWERSGDVYRPLRAQVHGQAWVLRLGDFPAEPLYTLEVNGAEIGELDDWPAAWQRAEHGPASE
jgi:hypothetical protein